MENISEGAAGGDKDSQLSAMLASPSAGGMRLAGNYAHRGSPGVVRRTASKPISIIRSTSVPAELQGGSPAGDSEAGGGSGGNRTSRRGLLSRDRNLQHDFSSGVAGGAKGIAQSLPPPQAPLLAGSLPPSRFLDDLPPLSLGPQADSFSSDCGALSTSLKANRLYATSCPANIGAHFGRPPGSNVQSMSVLAEGSLDEAEEEAGEEEGRQASRSMTALSILESLSRTAAATPVDGSGVDAESVESLPDIEDERLHIEDDVFELDGLEGVNEDLEALSLSEAGGSSNIA